MLSRYPWPLSELPPSTAAALLGGSAAAFPLAAQYNSGKTLTDADGELPRDADGYYLDPHTGMRLTVDDGYTVGGYAVGPQRAYGILTATVKGAPASARRSGWDNAGDADHIIVSFSTSKLSFCFSGDEPAIDYCGLIDTVSTTGGRVLLGAQSVTTRPRLYGTDGAGNVVDAFVSPAGYNGYLSGSIDGDTGSGTESHIATYNGNGVFLRSATDADPATMDFTGPAYLGRQQNPGRAWGAFIGVALGWDGDILTEAERNAIIADIHAGVDVDTIAANAPYTPAMASDGAVCGAYSPSRPAILFTEGASGSDVTVAQPTTAGPAYTQPADVAGLVGDWDGYAGWDGSTGVKDYGPNGYDMTSGSALASASGIDMQGRAVTVPGSVGSHIPPQATFSAVTVQDFTLIISLPLPSTASTGKVAFSWSKTAIATYGIQIQYGTSPGEIDVLDDSGTTIASIQCGFQLFGNGDEAHCIFAVRRTSGGRVKLDSWYDQDAGAGVQKPAQIDVADTFSATFDVDGASLGGRVDTLTKGWNTGAIPTRACWWSASLSDSDLLALAKGQAARVGMDPTEVT